MIFVAFGNSPKPFKRLAEAVDGLAEKLEEEVIVQNGYTHYSFKYCKCIPFVNQFDYKKYLKNCSVAILQGGWGGVSEASDMAANYDVSKEEFLTHFGGLEVVKYDMRMRKALEILGGEEIK